MRKTLSLEEQKLFELFGNFKYKLPKDPELMLYDFYFMTSFGSTVGGANMNAEYAIEEAMIDVVDALHIHMKKAVFFALCAEIRHLFDMYDLKQISRQISKEQLEFLQEYYKQIHLLNNLNTGITHALGMDGPIEISQRDRDLLSVENVKNRLRSHEAVKITMKKMNWSRSKFARFCEDAFNAKGWQSSYGGKPWAAIGKALYKLENAKKKSEKTIWIDHAYDLQHNTDTVFNKLKLYYKNSGFGWIKRALDWKRDVTDYRDFYKKVSPQLRGMVAYISKVLTGKSIISVDDEEAKVTKVVNAQVSQAMADMNPVSSGDIKIGDIIRVTNTGKTYPGLTSMGSKYPNWESGKTPSTLISYKVIELTMTGEFNAKVAIIQSATQSVYIIGVDGISKSSEADNSYAGSELPDLKTSDAGDYSSGDLVHIKFPGMAKTDDQALANSMGLTKYSHNTPSEQAAYRVIQTFIYDSKYYVTIYHVGAGKVPNKFTATKNQYIIKQNGLKLAGVSNDDAMETSGLTISPEMRSSNSHKFTPGDKVRIISVPALLIIDNNVKQWGQENGLNISSNIDELEFLDIHEVVFTGENDYYPGKVIVLIKPTKGSYQNSVYLIEQHGLTKVSPMPQVNFKFKIGDIVEVTDPGKAYTDYSEWASEHNFALESNDEPSTEFIYKVIAVGSHILHPGKTLYGIEDENGIKFIIDEEGLKEAPQLANLYDQPVMGLAAFDEPLGQTANGIAGSISTPQDSYTDMSGPSEDGPVRTRPSDGTFMDISSYSNNWTNVKLDTSAYEYATSHMKKFQWLVNAQIRDAKLTVTNDGRIKFLSGTWVSGTWKTGIWDDGTWMNGTWMNGIWNGGTWNGGTWIKGLWKKGTWNAGTWNAGTWKNGYWGAGLWKGGIWKTGTWEMGEIIGPDGVALYSDSAPGLGA